MIRMVEVMLLLLLVVVVVCIPVCVHMSGCVSLVRLPWKFYCLLTFYDTMKNTIILQKMFRIPEFCSLHTMKLNGSCWALGQAQRSIPSVECRQEHINVFCSLLICSSYQVKIYALVYKQTWNEKWLWISDILLTIIKNKLFLYICTYSESLSCHF